MATSTNVGAATKQNYVLGLLCTLKNIIPDPNVSCTHWTPATSEQRFHEISLLGTTNARVHIAGTLDATDNEGHKSMLRKNQWFAHLATLFYQHYASTDSGTDPANDTVMSRTTLDYI